MEKAQVVMENSRCPNLGHFPESDLRHGFWGFSLSLSQQIWPWYGCLCTSPSSKPTDVEKPPGFPGFSRYPQSSAIFGWGYVYHSQSWVVKMALLYPHECTYQYTYQCIDRYCGGIHLRIPTYRCIGILYYSIPHEYTIHGIRCIPKGRTIPWHPWSNRGMRAATVPSGWTWRWNTPWSPSRNDRGKLGCRPCTYGPPRIDLEINRRNLCGSSIKVYIYIFILEFSLSLSIWFI